MKNKVASIQGRLLQFSRDNGQNHQLTLTRYFQERFLYRLTRSDYRSAFLLKGGVLIYAIHGIASRPTLDIDFLGRKIKNDLVSIKRVFQQICAIPDSNDGLTFDTEDIEAGEIIKEGNYAGIRVRIPVQLGNIRQNLKIDIGFGDTIVPGPVEMSYPTLLELAEPIVLTYSIETLVAEKFEAMISLGQFNSRMKDFYDLYTILKGEDFELDVLRAAVGSTFENRSTPLTPNHSLFSKGFAEDEKRHSDWLAFLKKAGLEIDLRFSEVMKTIREWMEPIYQDMLKGH